MIINKWLSNMFHKRNICNVSRFVLVPGEGCTWIRFVCFALWLHGSIGDKS